MQLNTLPITQLTLKQLRLKSLNLLPFHRILEYLVSHRRQQHLTSDMHLLPLSSITTNKSLNINKLPLSILRKELHLTNERDTINLLSLNPLNLPFHQVLPRPCLLLYYPL